VEVESLTVCAQVSAAVAGFVLSVGLETLLNQVRQWVSFLRVLPIVLCSVKRMSGGVCALCLLE
jgi:hypothetical protein